MTYEEYRANLAGLGGKQQLDEPQKMDANMLGEFFRGVARGTEKNLLGGSLKGIGQATGFGPAVDLGQFFQDQSNIGWEAPNPEISGKVWGGEHPFLSLASAAGENVPGMIGAGVTTALTKNPVLGAATLSPQVFNQTYEEALQRGLDPTAAYQSALGNTALATATEAAMPLTSMLKGGNLGMRVLRTGLQEGGEEMIQGAGQEAILRSMGAKERPFDAVISDLIDQGTIGSLVGGVTGAVVPASFDELTNKEQKRNYATKFFDEVMAPIHKQEGKTDEEIDVLRKQETEKMTIKLEGLMGTGRLAGDPEKLSQALELFSKDIKLAPFKGSFYIRTGKDVMEVPNELSSFDTKIISRARKLLQDGLEEANKHNIVDLPDIARHVMTQEIAAMLTRGTQETPTPWTDQGVLDAIREKKLKSQDPRVLFVMGGAHGQAAENTKAYHPGAIGIMTVGEVPGHLVRNGANPEDVRIIHSKGDAGLSKQVYDILAKGFGQTNIKKPGIEKAFLDPNATQQATAEAPVAAEPEQSQQQSQQPQAETPQEVPPGQTISGLAKAENQREMSYGNGSSSIPSDESGRQREDGYGELDPQLKELVDAIHERGGHVVETPKELETFVTMFKNIFGRTAVFSRGGDIKDGWAGLTLVGNEKFFAINLDQHIGYGQLGARGIFTSTAMHEIFHTFVSENRDVVDSFFVDIDTNHERSVDRLLKRFNVKGTENMSKAEKNLALARGLKMSAQQMNSQAFDDLIREEMLADIFAEAMQSPEVFKQLSMQAPTQMLGLISHIKMYLGRLREFLRDLISKLSNETEYVEGWISREKDANSESRMEIYSAMEADALEIEKRMLALANYFATSNRRGDSELEDGQSSGAVRYLQLSQQGEPVSSGTNGPIETQEHINPRGTPLKIAYAVSQKIGQGDAFLRIAKWFAGERAYIENFQQVPTADVIDQVVQGLTGDKMLEAYVQAIATDNVYPMALAIESEALKIAGGDKSAAAKVAKIIQNAMCRANEELVVMGNEKGAYSKSFTGIGGTWFHSAQPDSLDVKEWSNRDAFIQNMTGIMKTLESMNHPYAQEMAKQEASWMQERPEMAYFKLLEGIGATESQKMLIWAKTELEAPALQTLMDAGVLRSSDIYTRIFNGFSHRMFDKQGHQRLKGAPAQRGSDDSTGSSASISAADSESYDDFYYRTQDPKGGAGLLASNNYLENMREYLRNSYLKAQQYRTLNWLKRFRMADTTKMFIPGFQNDERVKSLIAQAHYVEYTDSPIINALVKHTGLRPSKILTDLGYINDKKREGLVEWRGFSYRPPFVQASLSDVLNRLYPEQNEMINRATKWANAPKRILTINPFDGTLMFASGILANAGWRAPLVLAKAAMVGLSSFGHMGKSTLALFKGEGYDVKADTKHMEELPLLLRHGFAAGWNGMASSFFEEAKLDRALTASSKTPAQALDEYIETVGFTNKVMFEHFLFQELYNVSVQRLNQFREMKDANGNRLMTDDEAARRVASFMNTTSNLSPSYLFGKEGPLYNLMLFTRGLFVSPIRVLLGASRPLTNRFGSGKGQRYKTGVAGVINPFVSNDISADDADFLSKYYAVHLVKMVALSLLAKGILQYALSGFDDDKRDEFGQSGSDPFNKKRLILNNPRGQLFAIRLPWKGKRGEQLTMVTPIFPEPKRITDMMGFGSMPFPTSVVNYLKNRTNAWIPQVIGFISNHDMNSGERLTDPNAQSIYDRFYKSFIGSSIPLSFGISEQEAQLLPDNIFAKAGQFGGANINSYPLGWWNYGGKDSFEVWSKANAEWSYKKTQASETLRKMAEPRRSRYTSQDQVNTETKIRRDPIAYTRKRLMKPMQKNEADERTGSVTYQK